MAGEPTLYRDDIDVDGWVAYLQGVLDYAGFEPGPADGIFGPRTEAAVTAFQNRFDLMADGVCGNQTWALLNSEPDPGPGVNRPRPHRGGGGGGGGRSGGGGGTIAGVVMRFAIDPDYDPAEARVYYVAKNTGTATAPAEAIQDTLTVKAPNGEVILSHNFWNEAELPPGETYTHTTIGVTSEQTGKHTVHIALDQGKGESFDFSFQHMAVWMAFADGPSYDAATGEIVYTARNEGQSTKPGGFTDTIRVLNMDGTEMMSHFPPIDQEIPPGGTYTQRSITAFGLPPGFYQASVSLGGDIGEVGTVTFDIEGPEEEEEPLEQEEF